MQTVKVHEIRRKMPWLILGCFLIIILAVIDDMTSSEVRPSFFYLIPILIVALVVAKWIGVYMSMLSAIAWLVMDYRSGFDYSQLYLHYWNMIIRAGLFLFVAYGMLLLVRARHKQGELTDFIIHDLRAPLTNVIMGLQNIQDIKVSSENAEERIQRMTQVALVSSNRILTLINSMMDMSKLESGKYIPSIQETEIKKIVDSALELVSLWAEKSGVSIERRIETDQATIYTDYVLTVRVLVNLLSNAIKVSPKDSKVILRVARAKNGMYSFSVIDMGPGIAEKWQNKIFDKFAQVEARKKGSGVGSGLGLTFCQLAVEQLGGNIVLNSQLQKGTTVTVELPFPKKLKFKK